MADLKSSLPADFTVVQLIDALGGPTAFARICGFATHAHARGGDMRRRESINVKHWGAVITAARIAGLFNVGYESIAHAHRRKAKKTSLVRGGKRK